MKRHFRLLCCYTLNKTHKWLENMSITSDNIKSWDDSPAIDEKLLVILEVVNHDDDSKIIQYPAHAATPYFFIKDRSTEKIYGPVERLESVDVQD